MIIKKNTIKWSKKKKKRKANQLKDFNKKLKKYQLKWKKYQLQDIKDNLKMMH